MLEMKELTRPHLLKEFTSTEDLVHRYLTVFGIKKITEVFQRFIDEKK